jgi:hypothetical protein
MPQNTNLDPITAPQSKSDDPGATFGLYLLAGTMCILVVLLAADLIAALIR